MGSWIPDSKLAYLAATNKKSDNRFIYINVFDKTSTKLYIICSDGSLTVANIEQGECIRTLRTAFFS